jgi:hypothetical protein
MSDPAEPSSGAPSNNGRKPDGTFGAGNTFGHKGKPKGVRHRATKVFDAVMVKGIKDAAKNLSAAVATGEPWAVTLIARSMLPKRIDLIDEPVETRAPVTAAEAVEALAEIYAGVASGTIGFEAAKALTAPLQTFVSATNVAKLESEVAEARETIAKLKAEIETMRRSPP